MCSLADEALRIYAEEDLIEATPTPSDNNTVTENQPTTKEYTPSQEEKTKDLQKALHSILHSNSSTAILNAPRSNPLYRLDNDLFRFAIARQLR
eukprot:15194400-Ditylum_brightwellii.AAC.1